MWPVKIWLLICQYLRYCYSSAIDLNTGCSSPLLQRASSAHCVKFNEWYIQQLINHPPVYLSWWSIPSMGGLYGSIPSILRTAKHAFCPRDRHTFGLATSAEPSWRLPFSELPSQFSSRMLCGPCSPFGGVVWGGDFFMLGASFLPGAHVSHMLKQIAKETTTRVQKVSTRNGIQRQTILCRCNPCDAAVLLRGVGEAKPHGVLLGSN